MAAGFLRLFPVLEDVLIEFWQEGIGVGNPYVRQTASGYGRLHSLTSPVISCANWNCRGGGFDILQDISRMVHERLTTKEFVQACRNSQGSKKEPGCVNLLYYRLTLKYVSG